MNRQGVKSASQAALHLFAKGGERVKYLIVVDMQNDFITGSLGTREAQAILPEVVSKAAGYEGRVIFTRDTHGEDYLDTQAGKLLPVKHCICGEEGWELADGLKELAGKDGSRVYDKPAFGCRELAEDLKKEHDSQPIEEILLCGLCTDICVISNALILKAFLPEVPIAVDASCCAGVTPESHQNALLAMKMCQIDIKNNEK